MTDSITAIVVELTRARDALRVVRERITDAERITTDPHVRWPLEDALRVIDRALEGP